MEKAYMLKKQLHDAMDNIKSMRIEYNSLEANAQLQLEIQRECRLKLEKCNSYIVKLQNELQVLRMEKEAAKQTARKAEEHKEQVQDLIEENKTLEDKLSKLCELAFVGQEDTVQSTNPLIEEHLTALEEKNSEYREQIVKLTEDVERYEEMASSYRHENELLKMQCEELQCKHDNLSHARRSMESKDTQTSINYKLTPPTIQDEVTQTDETGLTQKEGKSIQTDSFSTDVIKKETTEKNAQKHQHQITAYDDLCPRKSFLDNQQATLEITINNASYDEQFLSSHDKTVILLDFLDFGTKASPQCLGRQPNYDFSVQYNLELENVKRSELDRAKIFMEIFRIDPPQHLEPLAMSSLDLIEIMNQDKGKCTCHNIALVSRESNLIVGQLVIYVKLENISIKNMIAIAMDGGEGKEEKYDDSSSYSEISKKEICTSQSEKGSHEFAYDLRYFVSGDDINYMDFLRFVDPPYPILRQLEQLQGIRVELKRALNHANRTIQSENEVEIFISEEDFVQNVIMLSAGNLQLDDIQELYRHIDTDGERKVSLKRISHFLYSPCIDNLRNIFLSFRKSSVNAWAPFKIADPERTGFVSKGAFNECLRSIGIKDLSIHW